MPIYAERCTACGHEAESIRSITAPSPEHCGVAMIKVPSIVGSAMITKGGNWFKPTFSPTKNSYVGAGRPKPKTITNGHGIGGRRKNPSIRDHIAKSGRAGEIRKLAKGKTT